MKSVRIVCLGLGTVGGSVAKLIQARRADLAAVSGTRWDIVRALVRQTKKVRGLSGIALTAQADSALDTEVDLVVELLGGIEPARTLVRQALERGIPVVTANKALLAAHADELFALADQHHTRIYFEATVGGGLPIVRTLREGLAGDRVLEVCGILNGTCNFVLGRMEQGEAYDVAVKKAQALGFAEADPTTDVSGRDTADKLAILARLAFGLSVPSADIATTGISELTPEVLADAESIGHKVKLLARARRIGAHKVSLSVAPCLVPHGDALSTVGGALNGVRIHSEALGETYYQGPGAGGMETASAVLSDLIEAVRDLGRAPPMSPRARPRMGLLQKDDPTPCRYYVRALVPERPGVLARIAQTLATTGISVASVKQDAPARATHVPIMMITQETTARAMRVAAAKLRALSVVYTLNCLVMEKEMEGDRNVRR